MPLNKSKGNMYPWVTHTWNPVRGRCKMGCCYCYAQVNRFYQGEPTLREKELTTDLGEGNFIFVGSMHDIWGDWIPDDWLTKILQHCRKFKNRYLFQSKNPKRFLDFALLLPSRENVILGTTIETNRQECLGRSLIEFLLRVHNVAVLQPFFDMMVSIEPIMDFDIKEMMWAIDRIRPKFVTIGADSKGHDLPEPSSQKIRKLISALDMHGIEVKIKDNLRRLTDE